MVAKKSDGAAREPELTVEMLVDKQTQSHEELHGRAEGEENIEDSS